MDHDPKIKEWLAGYVEHQVNREGGCFFVVVLSAYRVRICLSLIADVSVILIVSSERHITLMFIYVSIAEGCTLS